MKEGELVSMIKNNLSITERKEYDDVTSHDKLTNSASIIFDSYGVAALLENSSSSIGCSSISTSSCSSGSDCQNYDDDLNDSIDYKNHSTEDDVEEDFAFIDDEDTTSDHDLFTIQQLRLFMLDQINNKNNESQMKEKEEEQKKEVEKNEELTEEHADHEILMKEEKDSNVSSSLSVLINITRKSTEVTVLVLLCYAISIQFDTLMNVPSGEIMKVASKIVSTFGNNDSILS